MVVLECVERCENRAQKSAPDLVVETMGVDSDLGPWYPTLSYFKNRLVGGAFKINHVQGFRLRPSDPIFGTDTGAATS